MIESRKPPFSRHILPFLAPSLSRLKCCSGRRLTTPRSKEIRKGPRSAHAPFPERNHPAEPSGSAAVSGKRSDPPLPALGSIGARQDGGGQALSAPPPPAGARFPLARFLESLLLQAKEEGKTTFLSAKGGALLLSCGHCPPSCPPSARLPPPGSFPSRPVLPSTSHTPSNTCTLHTPPPFKVTTSRLTFPPSTFPSVIPLPPPPHFLSAASLAAFLLASSGSSPPVCACFAS